jgi:hypothetical protein
LEDLRQDVKRTEDVHQTALTLTEFIEKRGDELWADELLEGLGPWLMVQLCDLAAFFEVLRKYVFPFFHEELTDIFEASTNGENPAEHWPPSQSSSLESSPLVSHPCGCSLNSER